MKWNQNVICWKFTIVLAVILKVSLHLPYPLPQIKPNPNSLVFSKALYIGFKHLLKIFRYNFHYMHFIKHFWVSHYKPSWFFRLRTPEWPTSRKCLGAQTNTHSIITTTQIALKRTICSNPGPIINFSWEIYQRGDKIERTILRVIFSSIKYWEAPVINLG